MHVHARHKVPGAQPMRPAGFDNLDRAPVAARPDCESDAPRCRLEPGPDPAWRGMAEQPSAVRHGRAFLSRSSEPEAAGQHRARRTAEGRSDRRAGCV